ncbi:hypothetical protein [Bacteroides stercorirosoris]|uniref:Fimbrillin family protein n=1 Tax=Bacteroides stercorirosoris TaxID=871324 RepID=A0A1M6C0W2_9BACE|nr:hypothetical protein [Bacteroides stercorirosoris]SHI54338.1 hypothetical protein SAMN05444350_103240 [Bacteroides stercorirosoris]
MIRNIFLLVLSALAAWSCTATDDEMPQGPANGTQPADARNSLCITIAPKPAFTQAAITMPDGKNSTNTRALQTEKETKWEKGDVVWLYASFTTGSGERPYYSALKYTGTTWRYLTENEADEFGLKTFGSYHFNRTLIYDNLGGSGKFISVKIYAYYTGNGKPDKNGIITIPSPDSGTSVPVMQASSVSGDFSRPLTLSFTYRCSRLRIPAGYSLEMENYGYYASYQLGDMSLPGPNYSTTPLQLSAADKDRDVFLLPVADANGTPVPVTLTLNGGAKWTFTPQLPTGTGSVTDYYGQSYTLPALGSGSVTPGGM